MTRFIYNSVMADCFVRDIMTIRQYGVLCLYLRLKLIEFYFRFYKAVAFQQQHSICQRYSRHYFLFLAHCFSLRCLQVTTVSVECRSSASWRKRLEYAKQRRRRSQTTQITKRLTRYTGLVLTYLGLS